MYGHRDHALLGARRVAQQDPPGMRAAAFRPKTFPRMPSRSHAMNFPIGRSLGRAPQSIDNIAMPPPCPRFTHAVLPQRIPSPESEPLPFAIAVIEQSRGGLAREGFSQKKQLPAIRPAQAPKDITATRSICTKEAKTFDNPLDSAVQQPPMAGGVVAAKQKNPSSTKTLTRQSTASDIREVIAGILSWESDRQRMMRGDREPLALAANLATCKNTTSSDGPNQSATADAITTSARPTPCNTRRQGATADIKTVEGGPTSCDTPQQGGPPNVKTFKARPTSCDTPRQGAPPDIKTVEARPTSCDAPRQDRPPNAKTVEARPTSYDAPCQGGPLHSRRVDARPTPCAAPHQCAPPDIKTLEARPTLCDAPRQGWPPNIKKVEARPTPCDAPRKVEPPYVKTLVTTPASCGGPRQGAPPDVKRAETGTASFNETHQSVPPIVKTVKARTVSFDESHQSVPPIVKTVKARTVSFDESHQSVPPIAKTAEARTVSFNETHQSVPPNVKTIEARTASFDESHQSVPSNVKTVAARTASFDKPHQSVPPIATTVEVRTTSSDDPQFDTLPPSGRAEAIIEGEGDPRYKSLSPREDMLVKETMNMAMCGLEELIDSARDLARSSEEDDKDEDNDGDDDDDEVVMNYTQKSAKVEARTVSFDSPQLDTLPPSGRAETIIEGESNPRYKSMSPREDMLVKETMNMAMRGLEELIDSARDMARSSEEDDEDEDNDGDDDDDVVMNYTHKSAKASRCFTSPLKLHGVTHSSSSSRYMINKYSSTAEPKSKIQSAGQYGIPEPQSWTQSSEQSDVPRLLYSDYDEIPVSRSSKNDGGVKHRATQSGVPESRSTSRRRASKSHAPTTHRRECYVEYNAKKAVDTPDDDAAENDIANIPIASRRSTSSSKQHGVPRSSFSSRHRSASHSQTPDPQSKHDRVARRRSSDMSESTSKHRASKSHASAYHHREYYVDAAESDIQSSEQHSMPDHLSGNLSSFHCEMSMPRSSKHDRMARGRTSQIDMSESQPTNRHRPSKSHASANHRRVHYADDVEYSVEKESEIAYDDVAANHISNSHIASSRSTLSSRDRVIGRSSSSSRYRTKYNHSNTREPQQLDTQYLEQNNMAALQFADSYEIPVSRSLKHERVTRHRSTQGDMQESQSTRRRRASRSRVSTRHGREHYTDVSEYSVEREVEIPDDVAVNQIANIHIDPELRRRSGIIRRTFKGIRNVFRTCFVCCGSQFCDR